MANSTWDNLLKHPKGVKETSASDKIKMQQEEAAKSEVDAEYDAYLKKNPKVQKYEREGFSSRVKAKP